MDPDPGPQFIEFNPYEVGAAGRLSPPERIPPDRRFPWKYAITLGLASIAGSVLLVPFSIDLLKQVKGQPQFVLDLMPVIMVIEVGIESVFSIAMIALGLGLGRSLGLVWPPLDGWDDDTTDRAKRMRSALVAATASGIILAGIFVVQAQLLERRQGPSRHQASALVVLPDRVGRGRRSGGSLAPARPHDVLRVGVHKDRSARYAGGWRDLVRERARLARVRGDPSATGVSIDRWHPGDHRVRDDRQRRSRCGLRMAVLRKGLIAAMVCHTVFDIAIKVVFPLMAGA